MRLARTTGRLGALSAAAALAAFLGACGRPCRQLDVQPIELACEPGAPFLGELHLDDAAVFESFLSLECLPTSSPDQIAVLVDGVDFLNDVVFVAVGPRQVQTRCIESRKAASVAACDDGLRVAFDDHLSSAPVCTGNWTVAFSLAREDMRAALGSTDLPAGN